MALTFNSVDPRTGEPGPSYEEASPAGVRAAVEAAAAVHRSGALRDRSARAALLRGAAARLRAAGDEIVAVCEAETGLPELPRLRSELERTCGQLEAFAGIVDTGDDAEAIIDHPDPDAKPIPRPDVRRMRIPLGPVAVFGASNFPLAFSTAGGDTASALAAGCPVVVKGHPSHPGTGELVARELRAAVAGAGLPEGTFAHLPAAGVEVGEALVDAPEIAAVGFTGSFAGGKALHDRAARRPVPIPVYAEMGSVNPIVVTEAALRARAPMIAEGLTASVSSFGGQLCTKPGVVFVPAGPEGDAFAADLAARLDAAAPQVLLNERLRDALRSAVGRLERRPEVRPLGSAPEPDGPGFQHQPAAYEAPAAAVAEGRAELLEEHFGPVVLLLRHGSREELLAALERDRRPAHRLAPCRAGGGCGRAGRGARGARGARGLQRLPDRRRRHLRHASRRPVSRDHQPAAHVGGDDRGAALHAPDRLPGRAGGRPPARAAGGQSARHPAAGGRRAEGLAAREQQRAPLGDR